MADKSDEENLHIPTNNQSENRSDEIIPAAYTDTITQNQETENTEGQETRSILRPTLFDGFLDTTGGVTQALQRSQYGVQEGALARKHFRHISAHGFGEGENHHEEYGDLKNAIRCHK